MCIDRVLLEVVWKRAKEELVEDTALLDIEIVLDSSVTPVGQILGVIVQRVKAITSYKHYSIGQNCP